MFSSKQEQEPVRERNNIPHKFSHVKKAAGKDWLYGFRQRHPDISLMCPEATSSARASAFNKPVVTKFFNVLKKIFTSYITRMSTFSQDSRQKEHNTEEVL